ncbi:hypothetical protein C8Q80DRAFT_1120144 [Daedaleopsis nitida]|nr:hypothetical protein C8Q80DRAFT_1120144 [Daedaleopsis nitida]
MAKLTMLNAVALACAVAVQGASLGGNSTLAARACKGPDAAQLECQTSGGSPMVSDCVEAIKRLTGDCLQHNNYGSHCTTVSQHGTCKIDVCGQPAALLDRSLNCGGYLQTILNDCQSGGLVGGYLEPDVCNVWWNGTPGPDDFYRLQFSHS